MEKISIENIKTGDCMLESANSWLSRQIQKFQKKEGKGYQYNHAGMFWWAYNELMIIEADIRGIAITPFSKYMNDNVYKKVICLKPKFDVDGSEYGKFMLPYAGHTRYDKFNLIIAQAVKMLTMGKVWLGEKKQNPKKFICGEWCYFVYQHFRSDLFLRNSPEIAPIDLYQDINFDHYSVKNI